MKRCPICNRTYPDDNLNFCLDDGELLAHYSGEEPTRSLRDDAPPTVVLDPVRQTNPISWAPGSPPMQQGSAPTQQWQSPNPQNYAFAPHPMMMRAAPSQALPIVAMSLGIASITVGWCCYIGVLLGPAAMITGFIGLAQSKNNPGGSGGRGFSIAGIVMGALYFVGLVVFLVIYGAAIFFGNR